MELKHQSKDINSDECPMICFKNINTSSLVAVLNLYGVEINEVEEHLTIPHSFWGAPEAGRRNNTLYVRFDTPIHSILHETCHFVCMPKNQRYLDEIDAAGSTIEESACCYLQLLISDHIEGFTREEHMKNMDEWGYSFRLGSAATWFYRDADDARKWLLEQMIIDQHDQITWKLR